MPKLLFTGSPPAKPPGPSDTVWQEAQLPIPASISPRATRAASNPAGSGGSMAANLDDLAVKLAQVRAEVEAMVAAGRAVTGEELESAMTRVRTAAAAFREALKIAEAG